MAIPKLRPHQAEAGRAILESVFERKGLTFTVEVARQGGKNELSAQLEVLLLTLHIGAGGNGVKCSPTFKPQTVTSMMRLKERLNDAGYGRSWKSEHGYIIRLGRARQLFFSADKAANVVGATAHLLLEVDEAQDVAGDKYQKEFRPMGASTNVTTVLYGTAWDDSSLLERIKQSNLELERRDGVRRHFEYDWQEVARYNPDYRRFVEGERERLGHSHPLFLTQYCLKPLHGGGGFLSAAQLAQLQGDHCRRRVFGARGVFVAGIDLAGEAEGIEDAALRALKPAQDSTVVTIGRLDFSGCDAVIKEPRIEVVEHYWWTGTPHTDLYPRLVDLLRNVWGCKRVAVDATGVGQGVAGFLASALGKSVVVPLAFSAQSKSRLGFALLSAINAGRLKMYATDGSEEHREFWLQMERAKSHYRPNQTMNFYVDLARGHDDFLISLALLVEAASDYQPRQARGVVREREA
ncbi:MAG: hypothetical protein HYX92_10625 [Chloroflexi bacterium]|nr:hypothetical protein [Chloroflexota bacterium]